MKKKLKNKPKWILIGLVISISILHYATHYAQVGRHSIYRELYYIPIIIASLWYGLKGGLIVSLSVTIFYLPYLLLQSEAVAWAKFNNSLEIFLFNTIAAIVGLMSDREKAVQRRMRETESLQKIGQAVSIIAHDFKSPLMAIGGFSAQVRRTFSENDPQANKLDIIIKQTSRLETMVKDMLAFSKPLQLECSCGDINQLIKDTLSVLAVSANRNGVFLCSELEKNPRNFYFDHNRIQQALINLIENAIDASPEGADVIVRTTSNNGFVRLGILDQGPGINVENRDEIFKPFVTCKNDGNGLGLPIVKKVVEAHGGRIFILDHPAVGAHFAIDLPANIEPVR